MNGAGVSAANDQLKFCDSFYDDDDDYLYLTMKDANSKIVTYFGRNPYACDCLGAQPLPNEVPDLYRKANVCNGYNSKVNALGAALAANPPAPTTGYLVSTPVRLDDVLAIPEY